MVHEKTLSSKGTKFFPAKELNCKSHPPLMLLKPEEFVKSFKKGTPLREPEGDS